MKYKTNKPLFENILSFTRLDELSLIKKIVILFEKLLLRNGYVFTKSMRHLKRNRLINIEERGWEYVRYSTLELIAHEITQRQLRGNTAELGVYTGTFASAINRCFPKRKLYLFDTFEGFDDRDIAVEKEKGIYVERNFSDTNVDLVLNRMTYPAQCIVKKGFFPDTAKNLEDEFVFVSIDTDLYQPVYEGLKYFYPRLTKGGYIFVHDFNNHNFLGVREAVEKFHSEKSICYIPICDTTGTVIIVK